MLFPSALVAIDCEEEVAIAGEEERARTGCMKLLRNDCGLFIACIGAGSIDFGAVARVKYGIVAALMGFCSPRSMGTSPSPPFKRTAQPKPATKAIKARTFDERQALGGTFSVASATYVSELDINTTRGFLLAGHGELFFRRGLGATPQREP
jgi:hypothetical protein